MGRTSSPSRQFRLGDRLNKSGWENEVMGGTSFCQNFEGSEVEVDAHYLAILNGNRTLSRANFGSNDPTVPMIIEIFFWNLPQAPAANGAKFIHHLSLAPAQSNYLQPQTTANG